MEEEKKRSKEAIHEVHKFAQFMEKFLQEESEKKVNGLYEKLQETLEIIQQDLSSAQTIEAQLQKAVSFAHDSCQYLYLYPSANSDLCHQRAFGRGLSQGEHGH